MFFNFIFQVVQRSHTSGWWWRCSYVRIYWNIKIRLCVSQCVTYWNAPAAACVFSEPCWNFPSLVVKFHPFPGVCRLSLGQTVCPLHPTCKNRRPSHPAAEASSWWMAQRSTNWTHSLTRRSKGSGKTKDRQVCAELESCELFCYLTRPTS